jgi:hypothetical protein
MKVYVSVKQRGLSVMQFLRIRQLMEPYMPLDGHLPPGGRGKRAEPRVPRFEVCASVRKSVAAKCVPTEGP